MDSKLNVAKVCAVALLLGFVLIGISVQASPLVQLATPTPTGSLVATQTLGTPLATLTLGTPAMTQTTATQTTSTPVATQSSGTPSTTQTLTGVPSTTLIPTSAGTATQTPLGSLTVTTTQTPTGSLTATQTPTGTLTPGTLTPGTLTPTNVPLIIPSTTRVVAGTAASTIVCDSTANFRPTVGAVIAPGATSTSTASCTFVAMLSAANEVPTSGPTGAAGTAVVHFDNVRNEVCYALFAAGIQLPATAAHIHRGGAGVAGNVVVPFKAPDEKGIMSDCVKADAALINAILATPAGYYVNIHTTDLPNGAIRGQLMPGVELLGANEVPEKGDPNGFGAAAVVVDTMGGQVCYNVAAFGLDGTPTAAHIHKGTAGAAGNVVIPFDKFDANNQITNCIKVEATILNDILTNPSSYYVNVHTDKFPNGAVRGQLSKLTVIGK